MNPTRLQNTPRTLSVLRWLRHNPQHSIPVFLLTLYLGVWLIAPRHKPHSVPAIIPPPAVTAVADPAPPDNAPPPEVSDVHYTLNKTLYFREGKDRWRMDYWSDGGNADYVKFYCNRRFVSKIDAGDMGGSDLFIGELPFATRFPIIALQSHGMSAVGKMKRFYTLRHGKVDLLLQMEVWSGGPVFGKQDRRGTRQWITDDFVFNCSPDYYGEHLLIYKLQPNGDLLLLKTVPNKQHRSPSNGMVHWLN